jgi:hypothetical protein
MWKREHADERGGYRERTDQDRDRHRLPARH